MTSPAVPPPEPGQRPHAELRVGDVERNDALDVLQEAFGRGRLDQDEYEQRMDAVLHAKTYGELDTLMVDLPEKTEREQRAKEAARRAREVAAGAAKWRSWLTVSAVLTVIWLIQIGASHEVHGFWPAWVIGIWGVMLLMGHDRSHGRRGGPSGGPGRPSGRPPELGEGPERDDRPF